jgi:predicted nucleic acid-binding protein
VPDWVLDTVALVDYYCNRPGVVPYFELILSGQATGAYSTLAELELWQGIRPGEEERHTALLALLERVVVDGPIARRAGELRRQFGPDRLSLPDAVMAASANITGRILLTRNTRDFDALTSVIEVEFYQNP